MNTFFKYIKSLAIFLSSILVIPLFLTIFNLLKINTSRVMIIIVGSILMLIIGFITGRSSNSKGYLNGLLISLISILILLIISLIFRVTLNLNSLMYYIILIFSTVLGSMIGINKKKKHR